MCQHRGNGPQSQPTRNAHLVWKNKSFSILFYDFAFSKDLLKIHFEIYSTIMHQDKDLLEDQQMLEQAESSISQIGLVAGKDYISQLD